MLVAISIYTKPLTEVDRYRSEHHQYLQFWFEKGKLLVCGRQTPPEGGLIIAKTELIDEFREILDNDPFSKEKVAKYKIIEFIPSRWDKSLDVFLNKQPEKGEFH